MTGYLPPSLRSGLKAPFVEKIDVAAVTAIAFQDTLFFKYADELGHCRMTYLKIGSSFPETRCSTGSFNLFLKIDQKLFLFGS